MSKQPTNLAGLLDEGNAATTSVVTGSTEAVQISVRTDRPRYNRLKKAGIATEKTHREIMLEGLDLWFRENGY